MITRKLLFDGESITFLIAQDANLLKGTFLVGGISKFLAVFPAFSEFRERGRVGWGEPTPGGSSKATSKEGTVLVKRRMNRV